MPAQAVAIEAGGKRRLGCARRELFAGDREHGQAAGKFAHQIRERRVRVEDKMSRTRAGRRGERHLARADPHRVVEWERQDFVGAQIGLVQPGAIRAEDDAMRVRALLAIRVRAVSGVGPHRDRIAGQAALRIEPEQRRAAAFVIGDGQPAFATVECDIAGRCAVGRHARE